MRKGAKKMKSTNFERKTAERRRQYRATRVAQMKPCVKCESLWPPADLRTGKCPICLGRFRS